MQHFTYGLMLSHIRIHVNRSDDYSFVKSISPFDGYLKEKQIVSSVVVNAKSPNVITSNPISISNPLPHNWDDSVTFKKICCFWANKKSIAYIYIRF